MTDLIPYSTSKREHTIIHAIRNAEPPADLSTITVPDFVLSVLKQCWQRDPKLRLESSGCQVLLSAQSSPLLESMLDTPFEEIPSRYTKQGEGWKVIHNPESPKTYEYEFLPTFNGPEAWYARDANFMPPKDTNHPGNFVFVGISNYLRMVIKLRYPMRTP